MYQNRKEEISLNIINRKGDIDPRLLRTELLSKKILNQKIFISEVDLDDYLQREYYLNHKSKRKSDFNKFVDSQDIDEYQANGKFSAYWVH